MSSTLGSAFHGQVSGGEGQVPGSGGNNNSVYDGWGEYHGAATDEGYMVGQFPSGRLPSGAENQEFRISDSVAFNSLRGIAKTSYPFDPYASGDHPNMKTTALSDNFAQSDVSGITSLLPGQYSYNSMQGSLSNSILQEFDAGTSTYNSLPWARTDSALTHGDVDGNRFASRTSNAQSGRNDQDQQGINPQSLADQHRLAFSSPAEQDVPLTPFHYTYPNFGVGKVDYGWSEPGSDTASDEIIRAYHAVLPEGQLAGAKKELMPVFSGVNQEAIEQRPILQSMGKMKNTLYLGGVTVLPDELTIDPRQALLAGSNVPADLVQSAGELASAFDTLGWNPSNGSGNPFGQPLPYSQTLAGGQPQPFDPSFYGYMTYASEEPVTFASSGYEYSSNEQSIIGQ
jgi:hypothetical protein